MKTPLVVLLLLSLAGNAVLAVLSLRSPSPARPVNPVSASTAPTTTSPTVSGDAPAAPAAAAGPVGPATWQALKPNGNLHATIANLRAAGFPPAVVRAVAQQLVNETLGRGAIDHMPFWKQTSANPEYSAAQRERGLRQREMIEDLLGADARPSATLDPASRERRYGQLSDDKIDRIESLNRDISDLRTRLYAERKPGDTQTLMSAQAATEQEQRAELAAILTPAELEQYEMRSSSAANRVMNNLKGFEVTEAEYTELFRAQKAFEAADPMRAGSAPSQEAMVLRAVAQEELNQQARAVLTDDRFYEYLKGADSNYARAAQFAANHTSITPVMTYDLTQIERIYQATMISLSRSGAGGPPSPDRMGQLTAARKEYQDKITALLGPEIANAYTQRNRSGTVTTIGARPLGN